MFVIWYQPHLGALTYDQLTTTNRCQAIVGVKKTKKQTIVAMKFRVESRDNNLDLNSGYSEPAQIRLRLAEHLETMGSFG